ncbi:DUF1428 domain-containing protein [Roseococcus sp. YIM B11640]|uniref:DUF1428 domain-containing protein n=1 Tax=Roseococcus sp. YIM B11640 TaxID=3133973 RepID=UPI003C7C2034
MAYVEGFVVAVPGANKEAYRRHAAEAAPLFKEFGVSRVVEAWGDDVPDGKLTDFKGAVKAKEDESIVFAWFEYPDRAARDAATRRMMEDPRAKAMSVNLPFDGKRMIFGGFASVIDQGETGAMGYVDGSLLPVRAASREAYLAQAEEFSAIFREHGATRVVAAWADDVPDGKVTDFKGAVKAEPDEAVVYSWIEWPSRAVRDAGWDKIMQDPRMHAAPLVHDGRRQVHGGFAPMIDA